MKDGVRAVLIHTDVTRESFVAAAEAALAKLFGKPAQHASVALLWAQFALETGRGKSCWNYNLGNRKARPGERYVVLRTFEFVGGKRVNCDANFAAFESLDEGMADWIELYSRQHYAAARAQLEAGDAAAFAKALHDAGYFTAPLADYQRSLVSLQRECR